MSARTLYPVAAFLAVVAAAACDRVPTQPAPDAGAAGPGLATETQYLCLEQWVPAGFVLLGYATVSQCTYRNGSWNARLIGRPGPVETVCLDSPTPAGWVHTAYLHSNVCRYAGAAHNALRIEHTDRWMYFHEICAAGPRPADFAHLSYRRRPDCPGYADTTRFNSIQIQPTGYDWYEWIAGTPVCLAGPRPDAMHVAWSRRADCPGYADATRYNSLTVQNYPREDWMDEFTMCTSSPKPWRIGHDAGVHVRYHRSPLCSGYADVTRFNQVTVKEAAREGELICRSGPFPAGFVILAYRQVSYCPPRMGPNAVEVRVAEWVLTDTICITTPGIEGFVHLAYGSSADCGNPLLTNTVTVTWDLGVGDTICSTSRLPGGFAIAGYGRSRACKYYSSTGYNTWIVGPAAGTAALPSAALRPRAPRMPARTRPADERVELPVW